MRLVSVTRVCNECDIIEAFVRHHAALVDRLYIVDHGSSDGTPTVLSRLVAEGLPLVLSRDDDVAHYQGPKTTALVRNAFAEGPWDFVFPLDVDEFLNVANRAVLEANLNQLGGRPGYLFMDHYAPTVADDGKELDPIRRIVHRTDLSPTSEPRGGKVIVPQSFARNPSYAIAEGNHGIQGNPVTQPVLLRSFRLAHFPVRSIEQFISRVVVGWLAWISRKDYRESSGWVSHSRPPTNASNPTAGRPSPI
jgi:hypothetical protein